jgi:hypothetical protein
MSTPRALSHLRSTITQVRAAFATWAATDPPQQQEVVESVFELLAPCAHDMNGDYTLDAVSSIYEEHERVLPRELCRQLDALARAAHAVGRGSEPNAPALFTIGDVVQSTVDAQGLRKGREYQIIDIDTREVFGQPFVTYFVQPTSENRPPVQRKPIPVTNGHLVLTAVRRTSIEDEDA